MGVYRKEKHGDWGQILMGLLRAGIGAVTTAAGAPQVGVPMIADGAKQGFDGATTQTDGTDPNAVYYQNPYLQKKDKYAKNRPRRSMDDIFSLMNRR